MPSMLDSLGIKIGGGFGVTTFFGNLRSGIGTFDITATDQSGATSTGTLTLGTGSNFFTFRAAGGELITDVMITEAPGQTGAVGFSDFAHPRVSGASVIPEPSTWTLMLVGSIGLGFAAFRRGRISRLSGATA